MLTIVISPAPRTLRRAGTPDQFPVAFIGRITALAASCPLLSRASWTDVAPGEVPMEETRPFLSRDRSDMVFNEPKVRLTPRAALASGTAIHEPTTNAVSHGALSAPQGTVSTTRQIERSFAHALSGSAAIGSAPEDVRATLRAPIGAALSVAAIHEPAIQP